MKMVLTYYHTRNLFKGNEFKPFVKKYFKDVRFIGTECGSFSAAIEVSNYEEVKDKLPKYAKPEKVEVLICKDRPMTVIEWLVHGSMGTSFRTVDYCK